MLFLPYSNIFKHKECSAEILCIEIFALVNKPIFKRKKKGSTKVEATDSLADRKAHAALQPCK